MRQKFIIKTDCILGEDKMIYKMNINNYNYFFTDKIAKRGKSYYRDNRVRNMMKRPDGKYQLSVRGDSQTYRVVADIRKNGDIEDIECNCPYSYGDYCKHEYAALMYLSDIFESDIADKSSQYTSMLITAYTKNAVANAEEPVTIEPELILEKNAYDKSCELFFKLKIGRDKKYAVNDINNLENNFKCQYSKQYGKNFEFVHNYNAIDVKSRKVMELAFDIYKQNNDYYRYGSSKQFKLEGKFLERFLEIYDGEKLIISGTPFKVTEGEPQIKLTLKSIGNGNVKFLAAAHVEYLGSAEYGYFLSEDHQTIYKTSGKYAQTVEPLIKVLKNTKEMFVAKNDISAFYNTVVKQLGKYIDIDMEGLDENIIPPQLSVQLYADVNDNDEICAVLKFTYGDKVYSAFYDKASNPFVDSAGETTALNMVKKYFRYDERDFKHPLKIVNDSDIFEFISGGIQALSKNMEVYVSDKFKHMNVRKSVKTNVGVRAESGLLDIDISSSGYTTEELLELLGAYRKGKKYHRFKDGSFTVIDDGIKELDTLTKELNITDKAFLKENISVPMYRMLYLNGMQSDSESIRLKRSEDFKKLADAYQNALEDENTYSLPETLENIMRDYQKYGFRWLKTLSTYRMGGILADDMGLGKTIQAISLMLNEKETSADGHKKQFIVICPSSLTINWQNEIERFAPSLSTVCLNGTAAERNRLFEEIENYDVVITSYATVLRDIGKYENMHFAVQFLDEAQNIKNHNTQSAKAVKSIKSDLRFALTGTPVENTLAELWSIFDFIMPGYLHGYSYFKKTYELPIVKKNDKSAVKSLQRMTSPFILRRLKKEVLTELPDKTETVLITEMDEEQKKLYFAHAAQIKAELKTLDDKSDKIKILAMLTRLRQICCDPSLVYENYEGESAKLEQCMELVKSCVESGHKILLFSQFTTMLDTISERLNEENITYFTLTGQTKAKERLNLVNSFNENDVNVFLISLKAGGTGLNLTGADIVIHFDPWWNLSAENQASDRVYRIGQKNNVQIYKLITKDTIEEKMRDLQIKKANLFDTAVGGEGDITNMTADEIIGLL